MKTLVTITAGALTLSLQLMASVSFAWPTFTSDEVARHRQNIDVITSTAASCLKGTYEVHVQFYQRWGVSKYYGDRKSEHQTRQGLAGELRRFGAPTELISQLEPTSCIGLTVKCLGRGFEEAGMGDTWQKIFVQLKVDNKMLGTDLQKMLRELGWKTLYWNPDPSSNARWDAEDERLSPLKPGKKWNAVWGGHAHRYNHVMRKRDYYGITIDDVTTLVGFNETIPAAFKQSPFFVGTAHAGYHVFPGFHGNIIEAHSTRSLGSFDNLEVAPFNPLAPGGGPRWTRTEKYRSGVIVIPPSRF